MQLSLTIEGLAPGGEGVGRAAGRTFFVPYTAPGDLVEIEFEGEAGAGAPGRAVERTGPGRLLEAGPARVEPPCPHFGPGEGDPERGCGGCEWLHVRYREQLAAKERGLAERLRRLGGLIPGSYRALPILGSPLPLRYRCRAKLHLDRRAGRLVFFRRRSREPVPLRECHLLEPGLDALRGRMGPALLQAGLEAREVALEWSEHQGRGAAWLRLPSVAGAARERAARLLALLPALAGVVLADDGGATAIAGDPVLRHLRVPGEPGAGLSRSRPDVFRQANRGANALLVRAALDLLRPEGEEVLELFCGAGNFTGPLSARARAVAAVEAQGPALELARADAGERAPADPALRFFAGDGLSLARAFAREGRRFGAVLLDPPREGARGIGPALRDLMAPRAVYVSCDPATLARDLGAATAAGYRVEAVQPVDMFPQTHHLEAVALLERRRPLPGREAYLRGPR